MIRPARRRLPACRRSRIHCPALPGNNVPGWPTWSRCAPMRMASFFRDRVSAFPM
ncbi:MAG: hypothetical protein MZV64_20850 [Ignavibacteriales bacterium]|nr:hypothetical protein [Ignavibacteriales bacterium]